MKPGPKKDPTEFQPDFLGEIPYAIARYSFWGGVIALVLGIAAAVYLMTAAAEPARVKAITGTMDFLQKEMLVAVICTVAGSAWLFWEEEIMVALNLMGAALLFASGWLLPNVISTSPDSNTAVKAGYDALGVAGQLYLALAVLVLIIDLSLRIRQRAIQGAKKDSLRYGKGVTEESDRKNVFMGKCWQLPYCRKFVREKCPIYHAQRTCWRELVGCMCEEAVIRVAMEGKPISKEALLSGAAIPRNSKLPDSAKRERCRNCVIYNEHQKHKYRLAMPAALIFYVLVYVLFKGPLADMINTFLSRGSKMVTDSTGGAVKNVHTGDFFTQFLVLAVVVVLWAYTIKMIEYALFKLKI
ncbi:MAG: hypothetical protein JST12_11175 [Armatimonadetes bacterium]|nr:hypothetical protein [Armatimonadota bacterium]MBS1702214.1 hypothetical protein [Armatimonadota bacterium]MBS1727046.1 hypothetical protein [Armatimonadota bacterium]